MPGEGQTTVAAAETLSSLPPWPWLLQLVKLYYTFTDFFGLFLSFNSFDYEAYISIIGKSDEHIKELSPLQL